MQVVVKTVKIERKKGHKPVKRTITTVPYRVVRTGAADRRGAYTTRIHVTYKPARAIAASLTTSARTARGSATRAATVTILPPPRARTRLVVLNGSPPMRRTAASRAKTT